ncbi:MAG: aminomethyl-transferring glycine dehydrogenase subunit GcvPB [Deltaproteobacteria bacterium]|nr:aminomethyl-transferring glycine dehydrogenase subunit GcvPB [Deltaproteobacteria bacterium]
MSHDPARQSNWRQQPEYPTLFEQSRPGTRGDALRPLQVDRVAPSDVLPKHLLRKEKPMLPELSEPEVVRHYTRLSTLNYAIDLGIYPLGSCTMKYNPKINEVLCRLPGFMAAHPYDPPEISQGVLELMWRLQGFLAECTGLPAVTLHPSAGAQGELAGLLMIRKALTVKGNPRKKVIIPDSAHGTNPATVTLAGYETLKVDTGPDGMVHPEAVAALMNEDVAAIMITNPNTLGIFERHIKVIADVVHAKGGYVYMDGANMNALAGVARPADFGVDVQHINVHKTFSQPHGGGGPGAGPVCATEALRPYLPIPVVEKVQDKYVLLDDKPMSIGRLRSFAASFGVMVRTYAYMRSLGPDGIRKNTEMAVLNAKYLRKKLEGLYHLPYTTETLHETVFNDKLQKDTGVTTLDIAKRLIDYGVHPPTVYFPLVVPGALMIEPTESESKESIDGFCELMRRVAVEAKEQPELLKEAPTLAPRRRFDEASAARKPVLRAPKKQG